MQYIIFILELIVIVFYVDVVYDTSNSKYAISSDEDYSAYYSMDILNNDILTLDNLAESTKSSVWKASPLQVEILEQFPHMQRMQDTYNDRIVDNGLFKERFFKYMQTLQEKYIAGEIDEETFKKSFLSPPF